MRNPNRRHGKVLTFDFSTSDHITDDISMAFKYSVKTDKIVFLSRAFQLAEAELILFVSLLLIISLILQTVR